MLVRASLIIHWVSLAVTALFVEPWCLPLLILNALLLCIPPRTKWSLSLKWAILVNGWIPCHLRVTHMSVKVFIYIFNTFCMAHLFYWLVVADSFQVQTNWWFGSRFEDVLIELYTLLPILYVLIITPYHYATVHNCSTASFLTRFPCSLQSLFNMNWFTLCADTLPLQLNEIEWKKHVVGQMLSLSYNSQRESLIFTQQITNHWYEFVVSDRRTSWHIIHLNLPMKNRSPDAVEDISILEYPKQFVVRCDLVKVGSLFIREEQVRLPDGVQHWRIQVQRVIWVLLICQSGVVPLLP